MDIGANRVNAHFLTILGIRFFIKTFASNSCGHQVIMLYVW